MTLVRGIVVVVAWAVLFSIGGGLIVAALNQIAPGYYPGVFPAANRGGFAGDVGVGAGIIQGLMLGLLVGALTASGLAWLGQLEWIACSRGIGVSNKMLLRTLGPQWYVQT